MYWKYVTAIFLSIMINSINGECSNGPCAPSNISCEFGLKCSVGNACKNVDKSFECACERNTTLNMDGFFKCFCEGDTKFKDGKCVKTGVKTDNTKLTIYVWCGAVAGLLLLLMVGLIWYHRKKRKERETNQERVLQKSYFAKISFTNKH